jgi:cytochrome c1
MHRAMVAAEPRLKLVIAVLMLVLLAGCGEPDRSVRDSGGDAGRGKAVIERVGCGVCHVIPGVRGPDGVVGPKLAGLAGRVYLAGSLPNRSAVLAQFVRDAPSLVPETAMPDLPIDEQEARDVAAYLYSLR